MSATPPPKTEVKPGAPAVLSAVPAGPTAAQVARTVRRERARRMARSLFIWVAVPTLFGLLYYGVIAAQQYESVTTLVVTGGAERAEQVATLLKEHIVSRDMLSKLEAREHFSQHYSRGGDPLAKLKRGAGSESRFQYYLKHVDASYDSHSRVFSLRVTAFSGVTAQREVRLMIEEGRAFVESRLHGNTDAAPFIVVANPSLPDEATSPRRAYGVLTVFLVSLALFAIGSLLIAAVREHAQF